MKSDKRQTLILIGVALLAVAGVLLYLSLSQPRIYQERVPFSVHLDAEDNAQTTVQVTEKAADEKEDSSASYPVSINEATMEELAAIPGIGEVRASAIIEYREYLGGYTSVDQIMEIKGIGEEIFAQASPYLTV